MIFLRKIHAHKLRTILIPNRCAQYEKSCKQLKFELKKPIAQTAHLVFFPTHKPTLKKPKKLFFSQRTKRNDEYFQ